MFHLSLSGSFEAHGLLLTRNRPFLGMLGGPFEAPGLHLTNSKNFGTCIMANFCSCISKTPPVLQWDSVQHCLPCEVWVLLHLILCLCSGFGYPDYRTGCDSTASRVVLPFHLCIHNGKALHRYCTSFVVLLVSLLHFLCSPLEWLCRRVLPVRLGLPPSVHHVAGTSLRLAAKWWV